MSDKLTMRATDKTEKRLSIKVETTVKIENRAAAAGMTTAAVMNGILDDAVANDPWTKKDEERARALIDANFKKREAKKIKKGVR